MLWPHILEFAWSCLNIKSRLRLVADHKDFRLQGGLVFGTTEGVCSLGIPQEYEVNELNFESILWYFPLPSLTGYVDEFWSDSSWPRPPSRLPSSLHHGWCVRVRLLLQRESRKRQAPGPLSRTSRVSGRYPAVICFFPWCVKPNSRSSRPSPLWRTTKTEAIHAC